MDKQEQIANRIAEVLKKKGWTQQALADKMAKPKSYISKIVSGDANLTLKSINELEKALGTDLMMVPKSRR